METFSVFPAAGLKFLSTLAKNNKREWFQPRKAEFDDLVHAPMVALAALLNHELERIAPAYAYPDPAKALNRIYRDVRFSADKTPYQNHVSAVFPQQRLGKKQGSAFYISVSPEEAMLAGGIYFGDTRQLQALREHLAEHHVQFQKLIASKPRAAVFGELQGEKLQRLPRQFGIDHPAAELLRHKQWMLWKKWQPQDLTKPAFAKEAVKALNLLAPFVEFLNQPLLALPVLSEKETFE